MIPFTALGREQRLPSQADQQGGYIGDGGRNYHRVGHSQCLFYGLSFGISLMQFDLEVRNPEERFYRAF